MLAFAKFFDRSSRAKAIPDSRAQRTLPPTRSAPFAPGRALLAILAPMASGALVGQLFIAGGIPQVAWVCLVPLTWSMKTDHRGVEVYIGAYLGGVLAGWLTLDFLRSAVSGRFEPHWYLAGYCLGFLWLAAVFSARLVLRRIQLPMAVLLPMIWLCFDHIQQMLIAFFVTEQPCSLNKLGLTQIEHSHLVQIADLFGIDGVTWLVVSANGLIADLAWPARFTEVRLYRWTAALLFLFPLAGAYGYGHWCLSKPMSREHCEVGIISGRVAERFEELARQFHSDLSAIRAKSPEFHDVDLIVLSEDACGELRLSADNPSIRESRFSAEMAPIAKDLSSSLIVGVAIKDTLANIDSNSVLYFTPSGGYSGRYDKNHLGPGTESQTTLGRLVGSRGGEFWKISPKAPGGSETRPGNHVAVFQTESDEGAQRFFGVAICFDVFFPEVFGRYMKGSGAKAPPQFFVHCADEFIAGSNRFAHLSFACVRFRAIETRRAFIRSCSSGISGVVDSCGRTLVSRPTGRDFSGDFIAQSVPLDDRFSAYLLFGDALSRLCCVGTGVLVCITRYWQCRAGK